MGDIAEIPSYSDLLAELLPRVIHNEEENEHYTALLEDLDARYKTLNLAERDMADLLTLLVEDFESTRYELPKAGAVEVLQFLMEQHKLKQRDLLDIFTSPSIVSEVLSGKRELSKDHIRKLVARFAIPAELLL